MSDTVEPRIVERLRKLLALAGNNNNEHEAAAAMAKAQELMEEYNLTAANIDAKAGGGASVDEGGPREKVKTPGRALYEYQRNLMNTIATNNFCYCYLQEFGGDYNSATGKRTPKRKGYQLIGRQANVITTQLMFDYLNAAMERLVPIENNAQRLSRSAISWKEGFADRVRERLQNMRWEAEERGRREKREREAMSKNPAAAPSGGLVLYIADVAQNERDLNDDFEMGWPPGTTKARREARELERKMNEQKARETAVVVQPTAPLTESQKKQAEKDRLKNEEYYRKWQKREQAKADAKWARKDVSAYRAGAEEGRHINLDTQVGHDPKKGLGR